MNTLKKFLLKMIKNWKKFTEAISGWEIVQKVGPNYPDQVLPTTLSRNDTEVIMASNEEIYTYDDYQNLYIDYLKSGGTPLVGFNKKNLDIVLGYE